MRWAVSLLVSVLSIGLAGCHQQPSTEGSVSEGPATSPTVTETGQPTGLVDCGDDPIRVALYEYGYFFEGDPNGDGTGIDHDVLAELRSRTGCAFDVSVQARARIWEDLAAGDLDLALSGIQTAERDEFAFFATYLTMKNYELIRAEVAQTVQSEAAFLADPNLDWGVVRAFRHGAPQDAFLAQLDEAQRVQESPEVAGVFAKLGANRIQGMFSQPPVYRKVLAEEGLTDQVVVQDWFPDEVGVPHGLVLAKSRWSAEQAEQWRSVLDDMRADGTLLDIFQRYLPPDEAEQLLAF